MNAIPVVLHGQVEMTMTREQAEACYVALLAQPYRGAWSREDVIECFLICQFADALGYGSYVPRWMRERASVMA